MFGALLFQGYMSFKFARYCMGILHATPQARTFRLRHYAGDMFAPSDSAIRGRIKAIQLAQPSKERKSMAVQFLLPCSCGRQLPVETSQSGLTLTCECGKQLDVPTRRDLEKLPRAASQPQGAGTPGRSAWGLHKGLMLLGTLVAVPALACAVYLTSTLPTDPVAAIIERQTPEQSVVTWMQLRRGIRGGNDPLTMAYIKQRNSHQMAADVAWGVFAIGLAIAASGLVMQMRKRRQHPTTRT
jgi:hypothetical protein